MFGSAGECTQCHELPKNKKKNPAKFNSACGNGSDFQFSSLILQIFLGRAS